MKNISLYCDTGVDEKLLKELFIQCGQQFPSRIERWDGAIRQHFQVVDSTQVQAANLVNVLPEEAFAKASEHTWLILSAEEQTAGRGSHNRRWVSPPQVNLYVTFVLPFPKACSEKLFFMSQVASIAVARTVKKLGLHPEIKWPNDLMLSKKKVSGILLENKTPDSCGDHSVLLVGIGLNVNMERSVCESLDQPVTSLCVEANRSFDKETILPILYQDLRDCVQQLLDKGFSAFYDELNDMLAFRGETIILETAVGPRQKVQDFESESLTIGVEHSQKVKATPIVSDYGSKDCAFCPDPTAVSRIIVDRDDGESLEGVYLGIDENGKMRLQRADGGISLLQDGRIRGSLTSQRSELIRIV